MCRTCEIVAAVMHQDRSRPPALNEHDQRQAARIESTARETLRLVQQIKGIVVTNQESIDSATAGITSFRDQTATALAGIRDDVADLKAQVAAGATPESLDFSALDASVDSLAAVAGDATELDGENIPAVDNGSADPLV